MTKEFKVIGKKVERVDAFERLTGEAKYASDIYLPGMLYTKILRSPHPHARVKKIDASRVQALSGVKAILTPADVPDFSIHKRETAPFYQMPVLASTARYAGDEILAVAAVDEETAANALELVKVDYEILPFVLDAEEAVKSTAPKLYPEGNMIQEAADTIIRGDVEEGFKQADVILEEKYQTHLVQHTTMEPRVAVAAWSGRRLTLWDSHKNPFRVRTDVARALGIKVNEVKVLTPYIGGDFGDKAFVERYHIVAALLAKKTGRPVRIEYTREDNYLSAHHRYPTTWYLKYGVKKDGTLTAIQVKLYADLGAYYHLDGANASLETPKFVYRCPNVKLEGYNVFTNKPEGGHMRCVGHPAAMFPQEVHMDRLAEKLGMDPLAFRLKNCARKEDGDQDRKFPFASIGLEDCAALAAERIGWQSNWKKAGSSPGPVKRGFGMAFHACRHGGISSPMSAQIKLDPDGTAELLSGLNDSGGWQKTTMAMIAAEELGVPFEAVRVTTGDTDATTDTGPPGGSRGTASAGLAVIAAVRDAKSQLLEVAGELLKKKNEDLEIRDGQIFIKGENRSVPYREILSKATNPIIGRGSGKPPQNVALLTFGAHFAEVAVDTRTGKIEVLRLIAAHDVGRVINRLGCENQIQGGAVMGMGFGMLERQYVDGQTGICVNPNLVDFKIPSILDVPTVEPVIVEPDDPYGPFGAKGVGEPPYSIPTPAIANAIYNAIGVRCNEIPINIRAVLDGLKKA
ncbi:MAG TPA: xanthine dehydrogenase family protein molybdopterin-binding subunit [Syntrophorhabdales bacterium]|nr:xanthine dehydrogenase family protein molybdopterin-binding subunit [Syntrophorhabdales bacterium]